MLRPVGATSRLPVVVEYLGYGGGRSLPIERLVWPSAGYAYLVMDSRGQNGDTPDVHDPPTSRPAPGVSHQRDRRSPAALLPATHHGCGPRRRRRGGPPVGRSEPDRRHGPEPGRRARAGRRRAIDPCPGGLHRRPVPVRHPSWRRARRGGSVRGARRLPRVSARSRASRRSAPSPTSTACTSPRVRPLLPCSRPAGSTARARPQTVVAAQRAYRGEAEIRIWPFNGHDAGELHQQLERFAFLERLGVAPD